MSTKLGNHIRDARKAASLSQEKLGNIVGISKQAISKIENGQTEIPDKRTMILLAKTLNNNFGEAWLDEYLNKNSDDMLKNLPEDIRQQNLEKHFRAHGLIGLASAINNSVAEMWQIDIFVTELAELNQHFRKEWLDFNKRKKAKEIQEILNNASVLLDDDDELHILQYTDSFNVEEAVEKHRKLEETIEAWYKFEGKELPEGFSLNFGGWNKLSMEDKIQTVKDVKKFADEMNEKIDHGNIDYD